MNKYEEALTGIQLLPVKVTLRSVKDEIKMDKYFFTLQDLVDKTIPTKLNGLLVSYDGLVGNCPSYNKFVRQKDNPHYHTDKDCLQFPDWGKGNG